jgi:uncharacterized membrane protein YbhN (UPF0104 family)
LGIVWYFQPQNFSEMLWRVGLTGVVGWLGLTLIARVILVETVVAPLAVLGYRLRRSDAFWIGWIRTFSNQILPLSGLALTAHEIRRKVGISWSELAALTSPQFFLAAAGLGIVGSATTVLNLNLLDQAGVPMTIAFTAILVMAIVLASGVASLIEHMPRAIALRLQKVAPSFRRLAQHPHLIIGLVALHSSAILFRGGRLWILFATVGVSFGWREALLIVTIAESAMLFQITPGGLGLREGAIVGVAALVHIPPEIAVGVALIDRFFVIGLTTMLAAPAFFVIRGVKSDRA